MRDREPVEYTETQMVLIPVLIEAVLVTMFICGSIALVAILANPAII